MCALFLAALAQSAHDGLRAEQREQGGFSFLLGFQTGSVAHPVSYHVCNRGYFLGGKMAGA
jgi:hypothetical protein